MVGILLNDLSYEQDIRELLMAFYPGEGFAREREAEAAFYVEGTYLKDADASYFRLRIIEGTDAETRQGDVSGRGAVTGRGSIPGKDIAPSRVSGIDRSIGSARDDSAKERAFPIDYGNRLAAKTAIKRELYHMLSARTGKTLPWGTLTGIRPTKIALKRLEAGQSKEQIRDFMRGEYLTSPEKTDLAIEIAARELEILGDADYKDGYSLYVGIPFCPTTCLYCSFTSYPIEAWRGRVGEYLAALYKEMAYVASAMGHRAPDTVYFGGGTPTSLEEAELDELLKITGELFDTRAAREFTVEAGRPDSITEGKLRILKKHGVSRISINPQTMSQATLDLIGRRHTVGMVKEKFHMARELGFDNINMDLIIGLPQETADDVRHTMEEITRLAPDSLTVHSLAVKRASRLNMFRERYAGLTIMNTQEMIDTAAARARGMGLLPYYLYRQKNMAGNFENVGYAAPGKACLYNIMIMEERQTIAACGAGTTTKVCFPDKDRIERAENVKNVGEYIERTDEMIERKKRWL